VLARPIADRFPVTCALMGVTARPISGRRFGSGRSSEPPFASGRRAWIIADDQTSSGLDVPFADPDGK
jgi:hypothetical protein